MYNATSLVNGNGLVNLALISDFNDSVDFGSREHTDTASRPQLIVTFDSSNNDTAAADGSGHPHGRGTDPQPGEPLLGRGERTTSA